MRTSSFYSPTELSGLGLGAFGHGVRISRFARIYNPGVIRVGDNVRIDDFAILSGGAGITIGSHVHIGAYVALYGAAGITMEDFSGISPRGSVFSESDDPSGFSLTNPTVPAAFKPTMVRGAVVFRRHAAIGANATVLPGVEMAEGSVAIAHSLVLRSCEPWTIYAGSPARKSRARERAPLLELERRFLADFCPAVAR